MQSQQRKDLTCQECLSLVQGNMVQVSYLTSDQLDAETRNNLVDGQNLLIQAVIQLNEKMLEIRDRLLSLQSKLDHIQAQE